MANDSSTGGPLLPIPPSTLSFEDQLNAILTGARDGLPPLAAIELYRFIQYVVAGISGLAGTQVLPRWQPEPANLPDGDWAALGLNRRTAASGPYMDHSGLGYDRYQRHETIECLVSFYGDYADTYAGVLRDGLYIPQNNEIFFLAGFGMVRADDVIALPSLVKQRWLYRADVSFSLMREIRRTYPVLDLAQVFITLRTNSGFITQDVVAPAS